MLLFATSRKQIMPIVAFASPIGVFFYLSDALVVLLMGIVLFLPLVLSRILYVMINYKRDELAPADQDSAVCSPVGVFVAACQYVWSMAREVHSKMSNNYPATMRLLRFLPTSLAFAQFIRIGFGGVTTAVLVIAATLLSNSIGLDRVMWMIWWIVSFVWFRERIQSALVSGASVHRAAMTRAACSQLASRSSRRRRGCSWSHSIL